MLTKNDLHQIAKVIQRETPKIIQRETPKIVRKIVQEETPKIVRKIIEKELAPIKKDITAIKKTIAKIQENLNTVIEVFDREHLGLKARVDRIENHLNLPPLTRAIA